MQSVYLKAFNAIGEFRGAASLTTWLTRIAINEALERRRASRRRQARLPGDSVIAIEEYRDKLMRGSINGPADGALARTEIRQILEAAIGRLPDDFRLVFVLREIEGLSVEQAAEVLGVPAPTIKTRHLRARRRLQNELDPELRSALDGAFPFAGADCEGLTHRVAQRFCAEARRQPQGDTEHD